MASLKNELEAAEGRLDRLKSDQPNIRSRMKKIVEEEDRITVIKTRMNSLAQTQSLKQTPAVQAILGSLGHPIDGAFSTVQVKREVLNTVMPLTGPGSQEMPLEIDEEPRTQGPNSPQVTQISHQDGYTMPDGQYSRTMVQPEVLMCPDGPQIPHGQDTTTMGQQDAQMRTDSNRKHRTQNTDQPEQARPMNLDTHPTPHGQDPVQHDAQKQDRPMSLDTHPMPHGQDLVQHDAQKQDRPMSLDTYPTPHGQNLVPAQDDVQMSNDLDGHSVDRQRKQSSQDSMVQGPHMTAEIQQGGSTLDQEITNGIFDMDKYVMDEQDMGNVEGKSSSLPAVARPSESSTEWGWDLTVYDSNTGLYSFKLEDCDDGATSNIAPGQSEEESGKTRLEGQKLASLQAKVEHFEQQREALIKKQQSLVDALSNGFNGDCQLTANHIRAINQSAKDIQLIGEYIEKHTKYVEESRFQYLSSCDKDDRACVEHLKREIADIAYRLENVDPEIVNLRLEQTSLRNARTKLEVLENAISARKDELQQYGDVEETSDTGSTKNVAKGTRGKPGRIVSKPGKEPGKGGKGKGKGKKKAGTEDGDAEWSDDEAVKTADSEVKAAKALEKWFRDHNDAGVSFTYRKLVREDVNFLPKAGTTTIDLVPVLFASKKNKKLGCEYHRKGKKTSYKPDSVFELQGQVGRAVGEAKPLEGHMHCGCPIAEVALELFLWKTSRGFSSNPANAGNVYRMTPGLHMLRPSIRSFWNQSIRDYTGLCTEDFLAPDYGEPSWGARIALIQLHTQLVRLKLLGVPFEFDLKFKDHNFINVPAGMVEYGEEVEEVVMTFSVLEELWKKIEERPVGLIPTV